MTAPAVTARADAGRVELPSLSRLTWVTWRQHRMALAGAGILLGLCAVALAVTGLRMRASYAQYVRAGCALKVATVGDRCGDLLGAYYHAGYPLTGNPQLVVVVGIVVPLLIGMFIGAPLLAREFEAGTVRFAWTQAVGRGRWVAAKLGLLGAALAVAAAAFGALAGWWLLLADGTINDGRWEPQQFGLTAITFTGWVLLMFTAGVFAGALLRRTVPAMAATATCGAVLLWFTIEKFTGMLASYAPLSAKSSLVADGAAVSVGPGSLLPDGFQATSPPGGWVLSTWFTGRQGQIVPTFSNRLNALWNGKLDSAAAQEKTPFDMVEASADAR